MFRRVVLWSLSAASLLALLWQVHALVTNPAVQWLAQRPVDEVRTRVAAQLASLATPDRLARELQLALQESPVDWPVVDGWLLVAQERQWQVPPALQEQLAARRRSEQGWLAQGKACVACAADPDSCALSLAMVCNVAVELMPVVGDVRSFKLAADDYLAERPVDTFEVGLATVGLAATAGALVTAGASYPAKMGVGMLKVARKTGKLSAGMLRGLQRLSTGLVDFQRVPSNWLTAPSGVLKAVDPVRLRGLMAASGDLGVLTTRLGPSRALTVLSRADSPAELAALRRGSDALGDKFPVAFKALGKSRLIAATSRWTKAAWAVAGAAAALVASLVGLFGNGLWSVGRRILRRWARGGAVAGQGQ